MFVYVDNAERITAYDPNDMSGNTGWYEVSEPIAEPIREWHEVPIYKYVDGHVVSRTPAEIEADIPVPIPPEPTVEQRVIDLETAMDILLSGEVNDG